MGIGTADGKNRAHDAAVAAVSSPLIDFPIAEAKGIVLTITGSSDMTLQVYALGLYALGLYALGLYPRTRAIRTRAIRTRATRTMFCSMA